MNDDLFAELLESVSEGAAILRGEQEPAQKFEVRTPDIKHIRRQIDLTQAEFADLLGVSIKTLQNWEQGRRTPHGAARVLLQVAAKNPNVVKEVVESYDCADADTTA